VARRLLGSARHAIKLEAMVDQLEAELLGDEPLQALDVLVAEFDHAASLQIDEMVVMRVRHFFITRAAVAEIVTLQDASILEQFHRAIDGGDGDVRINGGSTAIEFFGVRMVFGFRQNARDHPALLGHAKAFVRAKLLNPRHALFPVLLRAGV
jgi:hypothetical protein